MNERPQAISYKNINGCDTFLVTDFIAGAQAAHRDGDVFGVIVIAAGGMSMVVSDPLTEQQANTIVEYIRGTLKEEAIGRGSVLNLNKLIARVREKLPERQILAPDDNVINIGR